MTNSNVITGIKTFFVLFTFLLVIQTVKADQVILTESFESNLTGWTGLRTENWEFTTNWAKDGTRSIVNFDHFDSGMLKSIGNFDQVTYECWFYDHVTNTSETLCMVSSGAISSNDMLLIGTETQLSKTHYSYFTSCQSCPDIPNSWGTSSIPRTAGWHQAKFVKTLTTTELYVDGTKIAETSKQQGWNKIGFLLNNWLSQAGHEPAIFDALRVYSHPSNKHCAKHDAHRQRIRNFGSRHTVH
ncbi:MAG TPA: hypothetical protein VJJ82_05180 [Candidatus Nanoarchaeia archaeon]|nr:hypothetical protein [Candidatus Nanoarchaeia archaeon]